jgi:DNA-binding MarR family transcriptional regulator
MPAAESHLDLFLNLNRAHAAVSRRFDAELGALHGLGLNDLHLLCTIDEAPDRRLRRVDLARRLGLTPSGVTWLLRPLIKRRLVANEPHPDDARASLAVLTPAGHRLLTDARPSARRLAQAILADHPARQDAPRAAAFIARLGCGSP